jgi:hypothetical protein
VQIKNWDRIKPATLLIVKWDDIVSDNSWLKDEVAQKYQPAVCKDVGWFINHDKLNMRLSSSVNNSGEKNITVIPKGCIRDVKIIKYER